MEQNLIEHDKEPRCDKERDDESSDEGTVNYPDGYYPDDEPPHTPEWARPDALSSNLKLTSHQDRADSKDGPSPKKTEFTKKVEASRGSYYNKASNKALPLNNFPPLPTQEGIEATGRFKATKTIKNSKKRTREVYEHDEDRSTDGKVKESQALQEFGVWNRRLTEDFTKGPKLIGKNIIGTFQAGLRFRLVRARNLYEAKNRELVETILKGERQPTAEEVEAVGRLKAEIEVLSRCTSN